MVRSNRLKIVYAVGVFAYLLSNGPTLASVISGIVWNDSNMDGIRDPGEPAFTNATVYLSDAAPQFIIATNYTDAGGAYTFTGIASGSYRIYVSVPPSFGITIANAGSDDVIDSDIVTYSFSTQAGGTAPFDYTGTPITDIDAGFVPFAPEIHIIARAGNARNGNTLFVTNGAVVPFTYVVSNSGNIALSDILVYDNNLDVSIGNISCPLTLPSVTDHSYTFSSVRTINISETNTIEVTGFAVNPLFCNQIIELNPASTTTQTVVIVVSDVGDTDGDSIPNAWEIHYQLNPLESNAPDANADSDWMTDWEEYLADTDPTNAASYFFTADVAADSGFVTIPTTSIDRVYSVYTVSTLMENPQYWSHVAPEQTGTGSAITFVITNENTDASYRTGVRLP